MILDSVENSSVAAVVYEKLLLAVVGTFLAGSTLFSSPNFQYPVVLFHLHANETYFTLF
jgi:hypothetical protein